MLNNFTSGGQVFLHKMRMLKQVISTTIFVSLLAGILLTWNWNFNQYSEVNSSILGSIGILGNKGVTRSSSNTNINTNINNTISKNKVDFDGAITYIKATIAQKLHPVLSKFSIKKAPATIDAYSNGRLFKKKMLANSILSSNRFKSAYLNTLDTLQILSFQSLGFGFGAGFLVFLFWSRFGKALTLEKRKEGSGAILSSNEVSSKLRRLGKASDLHIGSLPLVKDMETRHFLITGSTGSGKTNLIHNLLPQIEDKKQPAIIIDQTGEMIAKYYNEKRGDIIFNPFDTRSKSWDFQTDCSTTKYLEKFADTLIGLSSRKNNKQASDFWEESAQSIFVRLVSTVMLGQQNNTNNYCHQKSSSATDSIEHIYKLICQSDNDTLRNLLKNTDAAKYFSKDNAKTLASIMSVLMTSIKPLRFLSTMNNTNVNNSHNHNNNNNNHDNSSSSAGVEIESFSVQRYIEGISLGKQNFLFLSSDPGTRELVTPLHASILELLISNLMSRGSSGSTNVSTNSNIRSNGNSRNATSTSTTTTTYNNNPNHNSNNNQRIWLIIDELASLGMLPSLPKLMQEGRKYGGCVIASTQSTSQLYHNYGDADASNLIGLFRTKFAFGSDDPHMGELYSKLSGISTIISQQKNTSFGANEFRDGVSYNEKRENVPVIPYDAFTKLSTGECFVFLPEQTTRLAKIQVPEHKLKDRNRGFVEREEGKSSQGCTDNKSPESFVSTKGSKDATGNSDSLDDLLVRDTTEAPVADSPDLAEEVVATKNEQPSK